MNDSTELKAQMVELEAAIRGLSLEVEGWRIHTDSTGTFILDALRDVLVAVKNLRETLQ